MNYKFISVVVPAYNEEKYLTSCLASLDEQDYPKNKYELIVELSGSTDSTAQIAESFGAKITNTGSKEGVSAARDNGAKAAIGEIIAQTDADTIVAKNWLLTINKHFQDERIVGITGSVKFQKTNFIYSFLAKYLYPLFVRTLFLFGKTAFTGMNFAISTEVFHKIGGFNKSLLSAEDVDLGIRTSKFGKVEFCSDMVVYTSARRIEKSPFRFVGHHFLNAVSYLFFNKTRGFENIR